ncbi:MAG: acyltransferase [Muribaculaceae bacterium]|nr:acyltransferase [Muribaculaceae bacterium]
MLEKSEHKPGRYFLFIAYLQIIGIVLVVMGHSFHEYPDGQFGKTMLWYQMLYTVRMPLFMFVSGFLMDFTTSARERSWGNFALMKLKRLLLPYIVLSLITFVPRALMSGLADDPVELSWKGLGNALADPENCGIAYFWFLQSSLTLLIVVYGLLCMSRRARMNPAVFYIAVATGIALLDILPISIPPYFSLRKTVSLGIYFIAGAAYSHWQTLLDSRIRWSSVWLFILLGIMWASAFFASEKGELPVAICSFLGIMMMISLAKILEARHITFLDHLKGANYIIFLLSWYFNVAAQQVLHHYTDLPWWVYSLLSLTFGIYVPWLFYKWMCFHPDNRFSRAMALLLGQSIKRKR